MLYEVITQQRRLLAARVATGLLRRVGAADPVPDVELPVITSYSIHYTKLYDPFERLDVHERPIATAIRRDEAEALVVVPSYNFV